MGAQLTEAAEFTELESAAMTAALNAAREGFRGANPLVGAAILTNDGQIVTGHHRGAGTPHAEVDAITTAHDLDIDLSAATLFVTLEPCSHYGRTGPCTEAIRSAGIPSVIFAAPDPNPLAAGGGEILAEAGLTVRSGDCTARTPALSTPGGSRRCPRAGPSSR